MTALLAIIYSAFISLGLPDAIVGAAWPAMAPSLHTDKATAGFLTVITFIGTITASVSSGWLLKRFGTFLVVTVSTALTALACIGYGVAPNFLWLVIIAIPLGLGGGAIDSALNAYVALNMPPRRMNFLHASWGIGALLGPLIVGFWLDSHGTWRPAFFTIAIAQFALVGILILTRRLWAQRLAANVVDDDPTSVASGSTEPLTKIPGLATALFGFFLYCCVESTVMFWAATYLTEQFDISADIAATGAAMVFIGLTASRILAGFTSEKVSNQFLLFGFNALIILGASVVLIAPHFLVAFAGLSIMGFGFGPIYPTIINETPRRFGTTNTERLMGIQMGAAYLGMLICPPVTSIAITKVSPTTLPLMALTLSTIMFLAHLRIEKLVATGHQLSK